MNRTHATETIKEITPNTSRILQPTEGFLSRLLPKRFKDDEERLTLSPLEKWRKYRKFPCKLIIDILILIFILIEV